MKARHSWLMHSFYLKLWSTVRLRLNVFACAFNCTGAKRALEPRSRARAAASPADLAEEKDISEGSEDDDSDVDIEDTTAAGD